MLTFLYADLTYEVTCLKRRLSEGDTEADGKVKELDRQLKAFVQEKENIGRVSAFALCPIVHETKPSYKLLNVRHPEKQL